MKAVVIIGDGMSDHPVAALGGRTPLMVAVKPHIDAIARNGVSGLFNTVPEGLPNGSDVANLSVLGYDPRACLQGRGVLEAASMGVDLAPDDVAMRCNILTIDGEGRIKNHSAGHISTEEAAEIVRDLDRELGGGRGEKPARFHKGVSYRHLLVLPGGWASPEFDCTPPHDFVGGLEAELLPVPRNDVARATVDRILEIHKRARAILADHPVNVRRRKAGKDPANSMWVWSPGTRPRMETYAKRFGITGAVISAVDLIRGIGVYAGFERIDVEGATGLSDTNYEGKALAALDALERHDFVYVHVEASDEASHSRDLQLKIKCIEMLDERLVRIILDGIKKRGLEVAVAVLPDHPTPVETGAHANDPVPVAIWRPGDKADSVQGYDEEQVKSGSLGLLHGDAFIRRVIGV
ncbi:MAG: cofactor-independent phosphoglycerate mutase [Proteobacteria bacterium]|jgi:2,3-bisphosphoglycerate-independent phosphoglycerate mutase|nr:cofactor-independent phosphoglycerate mutase [Pseudomonadota bacterium]